MAGTCEGKLRSTAWSSEALLGTKDGVVRAWTVRRKPEEERWDAEAVTEMRGTPATPNPSMPGISVPIAVNIDKENADGEPMHFNVRQEETKARRMHLKVEDFEMHGYTEGCEGCNRMRAGGMESRPHSETCRARMEEAMKDSSNPRWIKANARELARDATDAGLARSKTETDKRSQSNADLDAEMEEAKLLNKAKHQERLKVPYEILKNILEKDPLSGKAARRLL